MVAAMRRQIPWMSFGGELNLWQRWHPLRPLVHWYNSRIMDKFLSEIYEQRARSLRNISDADWSKQSKSLMDVIINATFDKSLTNYADNATFKSKSFNLQQLKLFLFAGQDSTSTSICYLFLIPAVEKEALIKDMIERVAQLSLQVLMNLRPRMRPLRMLAI